MSEVMGRGVEPFEVVDPFDPADLAALAEVPVERLEAQICGWAARRAADECGWLLLIGEFDRRRGFDRWECRSTSYWLSWHCGLSMHAGRERVRVARALEAFALVRAEFAAGRLTYSKVRAVTRVATVETEKSLVELALAGTAAQLERICSAYRQTRRRDETAHDAARAERERVETWHDDDGLFHLQVVLSPEDGALVQAAIAAAREHLDEGACPSSVPAETSLGEPERATRVEGFVQVIRQFLSVAPVSPDVERRHLTALVDVGVLTRDGRLAVDDHGRCTLNGQRLTPTTARCLGLDAAITTILIDHRGLPLSVGRRSRTATKAQRLALDIRDAGTCRFPGCSSRRVDAHHITWWEHGGRTDMVNLVLLCRRHHRLIHHRGYRITLDADTNRVAVTRPDHTPLGSLDPDPTDAPERPDPTGTLEPGEAGTRLELPDIISGLIWQDEHPRDQHPKDPPT